MTDHFDPPAPGDGADDRDARDALDRDPVALASRYVDGDLDAAERREVEADPAAMAWVARFSAQRDALGRPDPQDALGREPHLAAALAAFDELHATTLAAVADAPRVDELAVARVRAERRARRLTTWIGAAAAVAAVAVAGVAIARSGGGSTSDAALETATTTASEGGSAKEPGLAVTADDGASTDAADRTMAASDATAAPSDPGAAGAAESTGAAGGTTGGATGSGGDGSAGGAADAQPAGDGGSVAPGLPAAATTAAGATAPATVPASDTTMATPTVAAPATTAAGAAGPPGATAVDTPEQLAEHLRTAPPPPEGTTPACSVPGALATDPAQPLTYQGVVAEVHVEGSVARAYAVEDCRLLATVDLS